MTEAWVPLATTTLASGTDTITIQSIPSTYRDLMLTVVGTSVTAGKAFYVYPNGDSANGTAVLANNGPGSYNDTPIYFSSDTTQFNATIQIFDYSATDKYKSFLLRSNLPGNGEVWMTAGNWASTNAMSSVIISRSGFNLNAGTVISLYGSNRL